MNFLENRMLKGLMKELLGHPIFYKKTKIKKKYINLNKKIEKIRLK
jgi:hypothetical protein